MRTLGHALKFNNDNKIECGYVDPDDPKKGVKIRGYNALKKRYSRWKIITDTSGPKVQEWLDTFWLRYCKTPRSEVIQSLLDGWEKEGVLKRVKK